jgi:Zn-dependent protease with chaperone function
MLTEDRGGDLHSNAGVNSKHINLTKQLLEHHEGKDEEILAILTHEFGHWTTGDIYITAVFDVIYMTLLGAFFEYGLNNPYLFEAFGFSQQSVFISVYLFYKVYSVTLDYP